MITPIDVTTGSELYTLQEILELGFQVGQIVELDCEVSSQSQIVKLDYYCKLKGGMVGKKLQVDSKNLRFRF